MKERSVRGKKGEERKTTFSSAGLLWGASVCLLLCTAPVASEFHSPLYFYYILPCSIALHTEYAIPHSIQIYPLLNSEEMAAMRLCPSNAF